ncbi:V-type ATP synthase subunit B [candidate division KSB1 bacterium]|nr:V-type ATP synthase subunit B [candidate division KSB1 bacterium]
MKKTYTRVENIAGNVITLRAEGVAYGELAFVKGANPSLAQVIKLAGDEVSLQVFNGTRGISTGDEVEFLGRNLEVPFSENLLGRIFTGGGEPRDKKPMPPGEDIQIGGPSFNPARRIIPKRMVHTGIPMIDVFNSLVVSQKLPIFSVAGEPYNPLLARVAMQAQSDIIILGGMGLTFDDYLFFRDTLEKSGAMSRSIMFVHTADDPTVECLLTPDIALAVAEKFAVSGKDVLVLLTDMTNWSDALKEIAITMEQIPSNRGYPGDLYSQLAARYEKAVDIENSGSITVLAVTTMPGDDVTHPIPDNTGYITEGQFYLRNGRIEPFGSLSRLKQNVNKDTREDHRAIMDGMIQLYDKYRDTLEAQTMGFEMSKADQKFLKYGRIFEDRIMNLEINIPLKKALDTCWGILGECFEPRETGIDPDLCEKYWSKNGKE